VSVFCQTLQKTYILQKLYCLLVIISLGKISEKLRKHIEMRNKNMIDIRGLDPQSLNLPLHNNIVITRSINLNKSV